MFVEVEIFKVDLMFFSGIVVICDDGGVVIFYLV